jgi:hypothetical protein
MTVNGKANSGKFLTSLMFYFLSGNGVLLLAVFLRDIFIRVWWFDLLFHLMVVFGIGLFAIGVAIHVKQDQLPPN